MDKILLTEQQITDICIKMGKQITEDLKNEEKIPVFVGVMKGALNFMYDLLKRIDMPLYTDFIQISSYVGTQTSGVVLLSKDVTMDLTGRTVVIIEDVIDTGISMDYLVKHMMKKGTKRVLVCTLFNKTIARKLPVQIDYYGALLEEDAFLLGYGLDYREIHRNEPYVFTPAKGEIAELDKYIEERK